jgi:hypothetical protein
MYHAPMAILQRHRNSLILDLALGKLTAGELADKYQCEVEELKVFVDKYQEELVRVRNELDDDGLWVTSKRARLRRYQYVLELLLPGAVTMDAMIIREIRSYLNDVADELGQLLNRGAGENNENIRTNYTINGVNPEDLT